MVAKLNYSYGIEQENKGKLNKMMKIICQNDGIWLYANVEVMTSAKTLASQVRKYRMIIACEAFIYATIAFSSNSNLNGT